MEMIRTSQAVFGGWRRRSSCSSRTSQGHALGGGLEIALACDIRLAAPGGYKLGTPEVTLGLLPGNGGTQRLPRLIGPSRALELLITGRTFGPDEAAQWGLVAALMDEDAAREYAERLAGGPRLAIAAIKRCVHEGGAAAARRRAGAGAGADRAAVPLGRRRRGAAGVHGEAQAGVRVSNVDRRSELARTKGETLPSPILARGKRSPTCPARARRRSTAPCVWRSRRGASGRRAATPAGRWLPMSCRRST